MKKSGIYKITNPKGEIYIGCSRNIHIRWMNYKNSSKTAKQPKLNQSFETYGFENHIFEIIEDIEVLLAKQEKYWIEFYNSYNEGLNSNPGGGGVEAHNENTKKLISEKGKLNIGKRKNSHWKGKTRSEENKIKISQSKKGKPLLANNKPIIQYDKQGNFIQEYPSIEEAAKQIKGNPTAINNALKKGNNSTSSGYIWKYKIN
jgi:group I intron endonuclease